MLSAVDGNVGLFPAGQDRGIERKRRLMDSVVQEDDPRLAKIFTRDELLEMLR